MDPQIYITGSGHTRFGRLSQTLEELIVEAAREADHRTEPRRERGHRCRDRRVGCGG